MESTTPLTAPPAPGEVFYPSSDGKQMAETGLHVLLLTTRLEMLREYFRPRPDVFIIGNIFLYYEEGKPKACCSPDIMVIKGVDSRLVPDSYKVWEHNAAPCVVIEFTSKSTANEDLGPKKEVYQRLGVREYFLFDPYHDYLPQQLVGYRLMTVASGNGVDEDNGLEVHREYEPMIPAADGSLSSLELGLRLVPCEEELDLVTWATGERLLPPMELARELKAAKAQIAQEKKDCAEAQRLADEAEKRWQEAQRLAEDTEKQRQEARRQADEAEKQRQEARRQADEAEKQRQEAQRHADEAEKERQEARRQADEAEKQRQEASRRATRAESDLAEERRLREQLEAELARLRAALPPEPPASTGG